MSPRPMDLPRDRTGARGAVCERGYLGLVLAAPIGSLFSIRWNFIVALAMIGVLACGSDDSGDVDSGPPKVFAVLAAFPAELTALIERATVHDTMVVDGRTFRSGELGGVPVVLAMTGIGLSNATAATRSLLDHVAVAGVVMSGVAGSPRRIGDVIVPETWTLAGGSTFAAFPAWLALVEEAALTNPVALDRCGERPDAPSEGEVCLPHAPAVFVGGAGESSDPFDGEPVICRPGGGDVFGCDIASPLAASGEMRDPFPIEVSGAEATEVPVAVDMETAAVAAEAAAHGLPFIAFRAVSDGEGDPLDLPGFPAQFFAYYRLAAGNAAAATSAFLESVASPR